MKAAVPTGFRIPLLCLKLFFLLGFLTICTSGFADPQDQSSATEAAVAESPIDRIDQLMQSVWSDFEVRPSSEVTDGKWCRRVYLDLLGRIPTVAELEAFVSDRSKNKHEKLVDRLLNGDENSGDFARNWTTIWSNLLIGRTGGSQRNSMISREGMQRYLRESFSANKPYDELVRDLITATGRTTPGSEDFNGATNFLIDKVNEDKASQATAATSRLFLGIQVQCTQCHNHPFNEWKQQKYWEMNAFFRQARAFRGGETRMDDAPAQLVDQDYGGENRPRNFDRPPIFYELRNGQMRVAYPAFIDGTEIEPSGYVRVVNRREKLAKLIVESPWFSRAIANRMWAHFMGYGLANPIDDLGPHNTATHPELLEYLSNQFQQADYDLRKLMRWIVLSKPYRLSSKAGRYNESDDPLLGQPPLFSRFYLRQMRAEELYESLLIANTAESADVDFEQQERLKNRWLGQFSRAFGTDEGGETTSFNGTIPQALMMFNGELIRSATSDAKGNMLGQLARTTNFDFADQVDYLFLAGLARKPDKAERHLANQLVASHGGNQFEALSDLWWVILNSNEFIFNH